MTSTPDGMEKSGFNRFTYSFKIRSQQLLDKSAPHTALRWIFFAVLVALYCLRVWYLQGFYIVTYGFSIYLLNLFIGFLQPQDDFTGDGPSLPTSESDEYRPFVRRVPEFRFWYSSTKAILISFCMTFFSIFDIPVFWPILLLYFIVLFAITMKRQIKHMIDNRYLPFDFGKKKYNSQTIKKKEPTAPMPKVRAPIRGMPGNKFAATNVAAGLKKVNKD